MRIQHNIMAMSAYRNYTNNVSAMKKNLEKLSSGYKINRAGDDAAGLAISEKMRAQITGLETAQKNAKDGISLVQTAEGALTEVHDMLNRMVELASMSANGTYDNTTDRAQLQKEMDQLTAEINRIADSSNFNGINLLDGSMQTGGGGSIINGIDRIIDKVLAAGEDPIDLAGERTILDSGSGSSQATKFDVDLTGLTGAVDKPTTPPKPPVAPDGALTTTATTEADNTAAPAVKATGEFTLGTGITAIGGATNLAGLGAIDLGGGVTVADLFTVSATGGGLTGTVTDITDATAFAGGEVITLTAKNAGALTEEQAAAFAALADGTNVTVDNTTYSAGANEGGAVAATPDTNVLTFDLAKLGGGQSFTINGTKFEIISDGSDASGGAVKIDINGVAEADIAEAISDALKDNLTDFDVTAYDATHYDAATHKLTVTMKGTLEQPIKISTGNQEVGATGVIDVATTAGTPANPGTTGAYASATYGALKAENIAVGTEITIGGQKVTIVKDDDADLTDGISADNKKVGISSLDKLGAAFTGLGYTDGAVELTDEGLKITAMSKTTSANALTTGAGVTIAKAVAGAPDTPAAANVTFDFKLGGTVLAKDIQVTNDATSAEIATAIYNKLADPNGTGTVPASVDVKIGDVNYTLENNSGKLSFTLKDDPTADNIKGNFDWDVIADEGSFKGNHTAGTTVTQQGQVGASNAIANTVFRIEKGDIKDGATITLNGNTVTLAVGENSSVSATDKSGDPVGNIVDLRDLDASNITDADLSNALGKIANAFKGDTDFIVGVNDEANGDTHTGLTVHKSATNDKTYDTKEKLAAVFGMTTPGTGKALTLQIGDTADSHNQLKVDIQDMHADSLGLTGVKISDQDSAAAAIDKIKAAINTVSDVRGTLGATQNRLDHTINNLSVMTENIQDAESTIRDVDVAEEMMAYTKNNILIQSAQAMLAQANQVPQGVLQLLQ